MRLPIVLLMLGTAAFSQTAGQLELHGARASQAEYRGKSAVNLTPADGAPGGNALAIVQGPAFDNGTIEADLAGAPAKNAMEGARGFIGIAFRVQPAASKFELIYIRPTNGRADDQLRRNHSTQYISFPDYEWNRLRKEATRQYESYVDLVPGEWTKLRVEVSGSKARLYVHGAPQPVLVVNDLRLGDGKGAVALWIGEGTEAYFTNLRLSE